MRISRHRWFLIVIPADVFLSIQNLASFFRQNFDFSEKIMSFTYCIYIIYIYFVELYIRVDAFRLSKALLFPLPKNDKKLLCSIWDYHTPSWVPPSIGSPLAWSCELTRFQVPLLLCAAVQAQPLLSVWHSPKYRVWFIVSLVYDDKRSEHYHPPKNNAANEWNLKKLVGGIYIRTLADIAMSFQIFGGKINIISRIEQIFRIKKY